MNTPTARSIWQAFAQADFGAFCGFAKPSQARQCFAAGHWRHGHDLRNDGTIPSPSLRSGPSQAGPTPVAGRMGADCVRRAKICFASGDIAVKSSAITTSQRGSSSCASRLSFSPFFPHRLPVACRTPRRAGLPVPPQVPSSPMQPRVTCSPVPSLVALLVPHPAGSSWACRPAPRATDLAAFGRSIPTRRTIRADSPGGPLLFVS